MKNNPHIFILLVNWNGCDDTLECLTSLQNLDYPSHTILIVDNGSTDNSCAKIQEKFPKVTLIPTHQNLGFAEGNNVGIRYALSKGADAILLLNNDTVVEPNLLSALADHLTTSSLCGPKLCQYAKRSHFDHLGGRWNCALGRFDLILSGAEDTLNDTISVDYICGAALLATREVFETVGLLDPRFFLYWEESDFCMRAKQAGFTATICPKTRVFHKISSSFTGGKPHTTYFDHRNQWLWIERNCSHLEKLRLFFTLLLPQTLKLYRHTFLKTVQSCLKRKKHPKLKQLHAALQGCKDALYKRYGNAPKSIFR